MTMVSYASGSQPLSLQDQPNDYVYGGSKWGSSTLGTAGGTFTWSIAGAGLTNATGSAGYFTGSTVSMASQFGAFDYMGAINAAFSAWSRVANISFTQVSDGGGNFGVGTTGQIRFGAAYKDGPNNVLASAFFPSSWAGGGDLVYDSGESGFWTYSSFYLVTLHELGHALGLDHQASGTAVMNPYYNSALYGTGPNGDALQTDDINGISAIYGAAVGSPFWGRSGSVDLIANFTGTGGADIVEIGNPGRIYEWTSNGSSLAAYAQWSSGGTPLDKVGDFNGDGRADLIQLFDGNQRAYVWTSTGSSFNSAAVWGTGVTSVDRVGDFNGDGRDDIIQILPGNQRVYVWTSTGSGFNPVQVWGSGFLPTDKFADVNQAGAGGAADMVQFLDGSQRAYVATSNGSNGFNAWTVWGTGFTSSDRLADFDGDGRADAIQILPGNQNAYVWLSTGTSFAAYSVWGSGFTPQDQFADINGDGRQDVIQILDNGNVYTWTSTGTGFTYRGGVAQGALGARLADMNGDGRADLIQLAANGIAYVWLANGSGGFAGYTNWGTGLPSTLSGALTASDAIASTNAPSELDSFYMDDTGSPDDISGSGFTDAGWPAVVLHQPEDWVV